MNKIEKLIKISYEIRKSLINMLAKAGSGHLCGSLGMADIIIKISIFII